MDGRRMVDNLWAAAADVPIDISVPRHCELLAREWLTIDECCQLVERGPEYRANLHKAADISKTLRVRLTPHGKQNLRHVRPRDFLEYLLNRQQSDQDTDRRRLLAIRAERDRAKLLKAANGGG